MKLFLLELTSYEEKIQIWFSGPKNGTREDFGKAVAEAMLSAFEELEDTVSDSPSVRKDYPLFVIALQEAFLRNMKERGFEKLEPHVKLGGDSYSVLWETPQGERKLTPLRNRDKVEDSLLALGVEISEEDPTKLIFEE